MARATAVKGGFTYIVASHSMVLYIGVTNDLESRAWQHKNKAVAGFTARYNVDRLLYYEFFPAIGGAIAREKQLKGWLRQRKLDLIAKMNPNFVDLAPDLFDWAKAER